ncbi:hypothetical protein VDGE_30357 [Verticillium dahliae]|uniref:Uncharacterized protein n=1 Tax=Verticillium dahliae TaxID=27337 RepID=A0A444RSI4_VERDA|nr:hypothetical protein VDGE_30357 [Verticillium dahliae]
MALACSVFVSSRAASCSCPPSTRIECLLQGALSASDAGQSPNRLDKVAREDLGGPNPKPKNLSPVTGVCA